MKSIRENAQVLQADLERLTLYKEQTNRRNCCSCVGDRINSTTGKFGRKDLPLDDFFEWQVSTGYYGYAAGSLKAVREAAKRVLTDTKTCTITNNYSGSPWRILVQTKVSETPDATSAGQSLDSMLDLMAPARPLGVIIAHQLIN